MLISEAISEERDITVPFKNGSLNVTYLPANFTPRQLDEMSEEASKAARSGRAPTRRLLQSVKRVVQKWDLEELVDGKRRVVPLDHAEDDYEGDPLRDVPTSIFSAIFKKVNEDQQPGEADEPSDGS